MMSRLWVLLSPMPRACRRERLLESKLALAPSIMAMGGRIAPMWMFKKTMSRTRGGGMPLWSMRRTVFPS
jgi:hypothetical protein